MKTFWEVLFNLMALNGFFIFWTFTLVFEADAERIVSLIFAQFCGVCLFYNNEIGKVKREK